VFLVVDKSACKALDDLSALLRCLRVWSVEQPITTIDVLMPPSECYYTDLFFQVKYCNLTSLNCFGTFYRTHLGENPILFLIMEVNRSILMSYLFLILVI
jgi:hypothetical protein